MKKNPFSIYDFLGYMFPGLSTLLIVIHIIYLNDQVSIADYFSITKFIHTFKVDIGSEWWESTIILIFLSYICGHIVSYVSSISIEYFAYKTFKYPSHYLLHDEKKGFYYYLKSFFLQDFKIGNIYLKKSKYFYKIEFTGKGYGSIIWRIIICIALFPISSIILLFGHILGINAFITRPLDEYIRNGIQSKLYKLSETLKIPRPDINSKADYHRIVMHYVYLNIPNCQKKTENYIAIYGLLRAMSLIFCIYTDIIIYKAILTIDFSATIDGKSCCLIFFIIIICNILFMGFLKFYRRFTLENYMALLTEKDNISQGVSETSLP